MASQQVHKSTHKEAYRSLLAPVNAPVRVTVACCETDPVGGVSSPISRRWELSRAQARVAGRLLRNEGAVGSNPITSTQNPSLPVRILHFGAVFRAGLRSRRCATQSQHRSVGTNNEVSSAPTKKPLNFPTNGTACA
jgi:hypothetical protein